MNDKFYLRPSVTSTRLSLSSVFYTQGSLVQGNLKWQLCLFFRASYLDGFLTFSTQGFLVQGNLTVVMFVFLPSVIFGQLSQLRAV